MNIARIGVLLDRQAAEGRWSYGINVFERYIGEVLDHAGIPFEWVEEMHHVLENLYDIVIVALAPNTDAASDTIWKYAERGGIVISFAGLNALAKRFGYAKAGPIAKGYAALPAEMGDSRPLRFLNAVPWFKQKDTEAVCQESGAVCQEPGGPPLAPALQRFQAGSGSIDRWSVDITGTIVGLQQGTFPVFDDGAPAPDDTGNINEGIWKAEDGHEMDWRHDRLQTETGAPYFAHPYADLWREAIVAHLLRRAADKRKPLPFTDYWPEGVSQVAMISHDSDRNFDEDAVTTMETLAECGIHSTWCMMKPGYSAWVYPRVKAAGHELALHFNSNANEGGKWKQEDFVRQFQWLKSTVDQRVTSNKNHFTRFEGWGELFSWCEACGIESDQTRGPSKKGDVGFVFGTCHPYSLIAWSNERNRLYNVLEIGFLTQDIPHFTDSSVVVPFLEQVERVRGVAHFLFHQGRIHSSTEVRDSLKLVVKAAKERGFVFWTGQRINDWERMRRKIKIVGIGENGEALLRTAAAEAAAGENQAGHSNEAARIGQPVVWRPLYSDESALPGDRIETRFGVPCKLLKQISL